MKNIIIILTLIIIMAGCSAPEKDDGTITIEFWTLQLSDFKDYINEIINEYETTHPGVKIKWLDVPFKEGEKRALAAAMSNKVPDVINLNPIFSSTLASKKALVDFNDYLTEEQKAKYLSAAWKACSLGDFTFGIPWYITSSVTIYNESDLNKAGLEKPPADFKTLIEQSKIIKDKLNKYAFLPTLAEGDYFLKLLVKDNVKIVTNSNGQKATFDTKEAIETLKQWVNLYADDYIPKESIVATHQGAVDKFQSGSITFIVIGPNFLRTIKANSAEIYKQVNVSPQIVGTSGKVDFSIMNFVVPIKSKHKKEAVDFAVFITNSKNQLAFSKITPTLPSSLTALNDEFFQKGKDDSLEEKARIISANQLIRGAEGLPVVQNQQELASILNYYIQKAILKKISASEALKTACKKWNDILER